MIVRVLRRLFGLAEPCPCVHEDMNCRIGRTVGDWGLHVFCDADATISCSRCDGTGFR